MDGKLFNKISMFFLLLISLLWKPIWAEPKDFWFMPNDESVTLTGKIIKKEMEDRRGNAYWGHSLLLDEPVNVAANSLNGPEFWVFELPFGNANKIAGPDLKRHFRIIGTFDYGEGVHQTYFNFEKVEPIQELNKRPFQGVYILGAFSVAHVDVINDPVNEAVTILDGDDSLGDARVLISVDGKAEKNAGVTWVTPEGPVSVPFSSVVNLGKNKTALYEINITNQKKWTYEAGKSYTLIVRTSKGTASATVTAPGGVSSHNAGKQITWEFEGTHNEAFIDADFGDSFMTPLKRNIDSPFNVPDEVYAAPADYVAHVTLVTESKKFTSAAIGSTLLISQTVWKTVLKKSIKKLDL